MSGEIWAPAPEWPEYLISTEGQVYSQRSMKFLIPQDNAFGYKMVTFSRHNKTKIFRRARLVLLTFDGLPASEDLQAAHRDGTRDNDRLENLYWATPCANQADRKAHGTAFSGFNHPMSKLTEDDVSRARDMRANGMKWSRIAPQFGVTADVISRRVRKEFGLGRRQYA